MASKKFVAGIDLGTSNCAVAFAPLDSTGGRVHDFPIPQIVRENQSAALPLLPSALYFPAESERQVLPSGTGSGRDWIAGAFARWRGARVPGRLITSAKSWLCHPAVDRTAPILPWGGAADVPRISPVRASAELLLHLRTAWNREHPEAPLEQQDVVITVPASFDEAARTLTVNAAREAGLEHFTLLEEPQAAFYQFSHRHQRELAGMLESIRLVLVIDVGGGTSDFTLVQVAPGPDGPLLKRIAVGEHLILGGDNMDAALARRIEEKIKKLSPAQLAQTAQAAREAKELLLAENAPAETKVAIAGEGSKLLGNTLSAALGRDEVRDLVLNGFFPETREFPKKSGRTGIQEMGLPYVADPAVTRHIAGFLHAHRTVGFEALGAEPSGSLPRPDAILLNGGVFNSALIAGRLQQVLSSWWPERRGIPLLEHDNLDLAVARGAAAYGLVRQGRGRRISGGTAHSFYIGVAADSKGAAEPAAICLVPRGAEEGETINLKERAFKLHVGRPVQFPLYTSTGESADRPGDLVRVADQFTPLPPIQTVLKSTRDRAERIPVYLRARLTEIGTVELWCVSSETPEQWRLEFDVRGCAANENLTITESLPPQFSDAREYVARIFGSRPGSIQKGPKDVRQLWSSLEQLLGPRDSWSLPVLRQLWTELFSGASKRRRSAGHERVYFQMLGFTLRPGFGYPVDEWRGEQTFSLFSEQVEFHAEKPNWNEFWILWRRISGGISPARQLEFWNFVKPHLTIRLPARPPKNISRPRGIQPEGTDEMVRAAAAMEHIPAPEKEWFGGQIIARLGELRPAGGPWAWSLGRLGGRVPLYGSAHQVVPPDAVRPWLEFLLEFKTVDGRSFALAQIARRTGDRLRDVDDATRARVMEALRADRAAEPLLRSVAEIAELKGAEEARAFGDSLPVGLQLARTPAPALEEGR